MTKLMTWGLADGLATDFITAMGDFKILAYTSVPIAANAAYTPAIADALAASFISKMGNFKLHLFTGTQPATSTALAGALTGFTRLITYQATVVESAKYPVHWDSVATGSGIAKRLRSQSVQGVAAASGSATWACICNVDDDLSATPTAKRYAFSVGTSGADVNLTTVAYVSGSTYPLTAALEVPWADMSTALYGALGTAALTYADSGSAAGIDWDTVAANSGIANRLLSQGVQGTAAATGSQADIADRRHGWQRGGGDTGKRGHNNGGGLFLASGCASQGRGHGVMQRCDSSGASEY
jgi:hypothetical protein